MENVISEALEGLFDEPPPEIAPDVRGMTSPKVRMFLNRLVGFLPQGEAYLEVGCHRGATAISALLDHPDTAAYICDDFSGFREEGDPEPDFLANWRRYEKRLPKLDLRKKDCFELAKETMPFEKPIGLYFYDGFHNVDTQFRAMTEFVRFWTMKTVIVIDDWNWDWLKASTWKAIAVIRPRKLYFRELPSRRDADSENFWNGVGAFYIER